MRVSLSFGAQKEGSALCLLYAIYHRANHHMNEYLNLIVAVRNTRVSSVIDEFALVIPLCRTDKLSRSFLSAAARL